MLIWISRFFRLQQGNWLQLTENNSVDSGCIFQHLALKSHNSSCLTRLWFNWKVGQLELRRMVDLGIRRQPSVCSDLYTQWPRGFLSSATAHGNREETHTGRGCVSPYFVSPRAGKKHHTKGGKRLAFQRGVRGTSCSTLNGIVAVLNDAGSEEEKIAFIQTPDLCVCTAAAGGAGDMMCCQSASLVSRETKVCLRLRRSAVSSQSDGNKWGEHGLNGPIGLLVRVKQNFFFLYIFWKF